MHEQRIPVCQSFDLFQPTPNFYPPSSRDFFISLMMEAVSTSETSVSFGKTTAQHHRRQSSSGILFIRLSFFLLPRQGPCLQVPSQYRIFFHSIPPSIFSFQSRLVLNFPSEKSIETKREIKSFAFVRHPGQQSK
jgi:hypothetical protein